MVDRPLPGWPRGLREELAAEYVGLSLGTFRGQMAAAGAPAAVWLSKGRKVYLREQLDAWLDRRAGLPQRPDRIGGGVNEWDVEFGLEGHAALS